MKFIAILLLIIGIGTAKNHIVTIEPYNKVNTTVIEEKQGRISCFEIIIDILMTKYAFSPVFIQDALAKGSTIFSIANAKGITQQQLEIDVKEYLLKEVDKKVILGELTAEQGKVEKDIIMKKKINLLSDNCF